ncbi:MAG: hypothetical protein E6Z52_03835 [Staphylococcus sp.]|nr:hypothetical protein [Staphylococcus sp.]
MVELKNKNGETPEKANEKICSKQEDFRSKLDLFAINFEVPPVKLLSQNNLVKYIKHRQTI